jgi:hypothetical protein
MPHSHPSLMPLSKEEKERLLEISILYALDWTQPTIFREDLEMLMTHPAVAHLRVLLLGGRIPIEASTCDAILQQCPFIHTLRFDLSGGAQLLRIVPQLSHLSDLSLHDSSLIHSYQDTESLQTALQGCRCLTSLCFIGVARSQLLQTLASLSEMRLEQLTLRSLRFPHVHPITGCSWDQALGALRFLRILHLELKSNMDCILLALVSSQQGRHLDHLLLSFITLPHNNQFTTDVLAQVRVDCITLRLPSRDRYLASHQYALPHHAIQDWDREHERLQGIVAEAPNIFQAVSRVSLELVD